jgi:hypothetical protein
MVAQIVKKFRLSYGTGKFRTIFTKASHCFVSWARLIQSTRSHLVSSGGILTWYVCRYLRQNLFLYDISTVVVYAFLFLPCIKHVTVSDHSNSGLCTLQLWNSSLCVLFAVIVFKSHLV